IPIISGGSVPRGREALSFAITSSLSAICFTCFGETKLTASMCLNPARTNSFRYAPLSSVGIKSPNPCHASRGHSTSFTGSMSGLQNSRLEFADLRIQGRCFEGDNQSLARVRRINNCINPQPRGGIARVCLLLVRRADGFVQFLFLLFVAVLAFALERLLLVFPRRPGGCTAAQPRVARRRPRKHKARVIGLPAHRVVARSESPAANHGNFWHHAVGHGVYHLCAGADDSAP